MHIHQIDLLNLEQLREQHGKSSPRFMAANSRCIVPRHYSRYNFILL
jgi:hypothetical protein